MQTAVVLLGCACICLPSVGQAQGGHALMRRLSLAASCAASFWDVQTTAAAVARGGRESNGLFADPQGRVRWGRMIGFKAGMCGMLAVAQESKLVRLKSPLKDYFWVGTNTGLAARFTISAIRNRSVANELGSNSPGH